MKKYFKWAALGVIVLAGVFMSVSMPQAVESLLPEVEIIPPREHTFGETVRGRGIIFRGGDGEFLLSVAVWEKDINSVESGQSARLYGAAIGDGDYTAVVRELAPEARQQDVGGITETVIDVVLEITNANEKIRPGYTAEALIAVGDEREILLIPYEAIAQDDAGEYVLALVNNTAVRRDIVTGAELAEGAELLSGLREGDVLIKNPEKYEEGALVKAV
jgi:hypothetical protein